MDLKNKDLFKEKLNARAEGRTPEPEVIQDDDFKLSLRQNSASQSAAVQTNVGRYMQEIQGMVFMAKQFPRNQFQAWERIEEACSRKSLAMEATYTYPRGGTNISGPTIRLAEVLAQSWGNMSYGVMELEQRQGESTAMAYCWDLETNTRVEKIFTVKHEMKAREQIKKLSDPRDIYELVANYGARRVRACILSIIPRDITEKAVAQCEKTLRSGVKGPLLVDRLKDMVVVFKDFGVTQEMIEERQGYPLDNFTEKDLVEMTNIFNALKDDLGAREDYFSFSGKGKKEKEKPEKEKKKKKKLEEPKEEEFSEEESLKLDQTLFETEEKKKK